MPDYTQLRSLIRDQLRTDSVPASLTISGTSLSEALDIAGKKLGVEPSQISYRLVANKDDASGRDDGKIQIVVSLRDAPGGPESAEGGDAQASFLTLAPFNEIDTRCSLRVLSQSIVLRVTRGAQDGSVPSVQSVIQKINNRINIKYDLQQITDIVNQAKGTYEQIGSFQHLVTDAPVISFDSDSDGNVGWITVSPPGREGIDPTGVMYQRALQSHGVVAGVDARVINFLEEYPIYSKRIRIAVGQAPQHGRDAQFEIAEMAPAPPPQSGSGGSSGATFQPASKIVNVTAQSIVARKIPKTSGKDGKNIFGTVIPARDGEDVEIKTGGNIEVSSNGLELRTKINGELKITSGSIDVSPVHTVERDVDIRSGNIIFLGDVIVPGNVKDGYSVKASGKIEVGGSVGKAVLDSEEDIIIHGGIVGHGKARINSDKKITAKYIENATVRAGDSITVSEGIINSRITSGNALICEGRRASIVGGSIICGKTIAAKTIGSHLGVRTDLCIGVDIKRTENLNELIERQLLLKPQLSALRRLERKGDGGDTAASSASPTHQKRRESDVTPEQLANEKAVVNAELHDLERDIEMLQTEINAMHVPGEIIVSKEIHAGVTVTINNITKQLHPRQGRFRYSNSGGRISVEAQTSGNSPH